MIFFFFLNTLLIWLPWRTKIKSVLNKLKVYKKFLAAFFFGLFIFVLLLFGPILKYRKNKSAHMSLSYSHASVVCPPSESTSP